MLALVIDDSRAMRMILKRILVDLGFEVVEAARRPAGPRRGRRRSAARPRDDRLEHAGHERPGVRHGRPRRTARTAR